MTRPEKGPLVFAILTGDLETAGAEEAGDKGSKENAGIPLNEEENSRNSLEHPLPVTTSTLPPPPPPPTLPPIFSIIQSTNVIEF